MSSKCVDLHRGRCTPGWRRQRRSPEPIEKAAAKKRRGACTRQTSRQVAGRHEGRGKEEGRQGDGTGRRAVRASYPKQSSPDWLIMVRPAGIEPALASFQSAPVSKRFGKLGLYYWATPAPLA